MPPELVCSLADVPRLPILFPLNAPAAAVAWLGSGINVDEPPLIAQSTAASNNPQPCRIQIDRRGGIDEEAHPPMGGGQPIHAVARFVGEDGGFGGLPGYFGYRVGAGCRKAPPHFGSGSSYRHIPIAVSICHGVAGVDDLYLALAADAAGGGNHPHVG